jgi:hypothetical protein
MMLRIRTRAGQGTEPYRGGRIPQAPERDLRIDVPVTDPHREVERRSAVVHSDGPDDIAAADPVPFDDPPFGQVGV